MGVYFITKVYFQKLAEISWSKKKKHNSKNHVYCTCEPVRNGTVPRLEKLLDQIRLFTNHQK